MVGLLNFVAGLIKSAGYGGGDSRLNLNLDLLLRASEVSVGTRQRLPTMFNVEVGVAGVGHLARLRHPEVASPLLPLREQHEG